MTVAYETSDVDLIKLRYAYLKGWNDASDALRTMASHDCFIGKPEMRLVLELLAGALKPSPDKSKMI